MHPYSLSVCKEISTCNETDHSKNTQNTNDNQELLTNRTLTETQKFVLRKGLTFIPKPKKLNIHNLHNYVRLLMHRMQCKFEFYHKQQLTKQKDPFETRKQSLTQIDCLIMEHSTHSYTESEQTWLTSSDTSKTKSYNLTRNKRKALNELINDPTLIINKADKASTVVVQDRNEYVHN